MKRVKLKKLSNFLIVRIPDEIAQELRLSEDSELDMFVLDSNGIIMQKHRSIEEICRGINEANLNIAGEWSNYNTQGKEW
ncbi:AbrB/MazE/SpoVT family DNA-binding domain-containing protein [Helicobacter sp. T3_23-1059]